MRSHLFHLLLYSTLVATYFGLLVRDRRRDQLRFGILVWMAMVGGALLLAFVMYPFPQ